MANDDKDIDEKLEHDITRQAVKISALLSGKNDKFEFLAGEEIWYDQGRIINKAKFTNSPLNYLKNK